ncbi:hypothetical protein [uncultured Marinobacter sp.]|uniref:COG3014 family protein n=1 Tax=uncultured Marinobacter sp. TaxID=187379 RepID=UPI0030D74A69|tara:strand:+ start:12478 stop:13998 length:1521 start_codon:yes stop_codon:yes gene_type:complete
MMLNSRLPSRFLNLSIAMILLPGIVGCSAFQQRDRMATFNNAYDRGNYQSAANAMALPPKKEGSGQNGRSGDGVLELLHLGEAYRLAGDYDAAISAFDRAESGMKYLDTQTVASSAMGKVVSVLVNESSRDYRALMSEAILVNTYKGLSFLAKGNSDFARIEFNRADDRTRRAVDYFAEDIRTQREAAQSGPANVASVRRNAESREFRAVLEDRYGDPAGWAVYADYIVPASTYLHGLYFLAAGNGQSDIDRAVSSFERVARMTPGNPTLATDAELAQSLAAGRLRREELPSMVWVLYENGLGPVLEEVRFDVPLIVTLRDRPSLIFATIALPRYKDRRAVPGNLIVSPGDGPSATTGTMARMGWVIRTEMQARFPGILTRAISAAVVKGGMQYQATEQLGAVGQIGSIIYTLATTQADLRSWQALPDHWEVARLERPADGNLTLEDSQQGLLGQIKVPDQPFTLIYVKRPTTASPATVMLLDLQGSNPGQYLVLPASSNQTSASL